MRTPLRTLLLVSVTVAASVPSLAEAATAMPQFDTQQICRTTANLGYTDEQDYKSCVADEVGAKKQLASKWTSFPADARFRCSAEAQIGGDPSYVELATCLDLDRDASDTFRGPQVR
ncbi:hypothetical protein [Methylobacterium soli]|uniref:DUF1311 domain-containing protein n=1 Tax=Methylobacterium soli TaxID=553447 RepID=A0A6L3T486_9HYPH|nr:hypothetical protein [Methylobacterium soli]KAB1080879.1 hypothetical protein F6X53_04095 [Methylobacterium soli]GJE45290.1 hypothetical protein AEGHOMDF_4484 [Methylobacterium soli]